MIINYELHELNEFMIIILSNYSNFKNASIFVREIRLNNFNNNSFNS